MTEKKRTLKIKGHESFAVREGWLQKGLRAVAEDAAVFTVHAGADALGVGTNMAKSIRYWMKALGLTREQRGIGTVLTELGQLLYERDPYLELPCTWWLLHSQLAGNAEGATSWYLFFNRLSVNQMEREEAAEALLHEMTQYAQGQSFSEKSVRDDCNTILQMYTRSRERDYDPEDSSRGPFAELGLLEMENRKIVCHAPSAAELPVLVVYSLLLSMAEGSNSLPLDQAMEGENSPGRVLFMNRSMLYEYLLTMQHQGLLNINRTAGLDMIYFPVVVTEEYRRKILLMMYR